MKVHEMEVGSEEWLDFRSDKVGGSEISTILGINPYKDRVELWAEKTGRIEPEDVDNQYTRSGHKMEPVAIDLFRNETGMETAHFEGVTFQNEGLEWMTASVDGLAYDGDVNKNQSIEGLVIDSESIVEAKSCLSPHINKIWPDRGELPAHYRAQVLWYCGVLDKHKAYAPVLLRKNFGEILEVPESCKEYGGMKIPGVEFRIIEIDVDGNEISEMIEAAKEFLWHVENDEQPETSGSESCTQAIKKMYDSQHNEVIIEGDEEVDELIEKREEVRGQISELEEKKDELDNKIKNKIGDNYGVRGNNYVAKWPSGSRRGVSKSKLLEKYPELEEDDDIWWESEYRMGIRVSEN